MTHGDAAHVESDSHAAAARQASWWDRRAALTAMLIVAVTALAYVRAFHAGFIWDDDHYITENRCLTSLQGLYAIWFQPGATYDYYPLAFTTHWIEYRLWGLWAPGYHAVNVLLHAGNAVLLWRLLLRLRVPGAALAALLFALHPVQVESVAWCTERKTLLATLLGLTAFFALLRYQPPAPAGAAIASPPPRARRRWLALALLAFGGAMLAKTVAVTFPPAMALVLWWRERGASRRRLPALVAMLALAAPLCWLAMWTQTHIVGAEGDVFDLSWPQRFLLVGRTSGFYLACLVWPVNLAFFYPRWEIDPAVWWQWLYPSAAIALVVALGALRRRIGAAPLAALLAYGVMLGPALGLFKIYWQVYSYVADHVQYAASMAPLALLAAGVATMYGRSSPAVRRCTIAGAVVALIALGALTINQTRDYHDLETLWRRTLAKNPQASAAHNNLASILLDRKQAGEAALHLREAIRLRPDHAKAMAGLGRALYELNQLDEAAVWLRRAIAHRPPVPMALNVMGVMLAQRGQMEEAIDHFRRAARGDPNWPDPHFNLGAALLKAGRLEEARLALERALAIRGDLPAVHCLLAEIAEAREDGPTALAHYQAALRLSPEHAAAQRGLAGLMVRIGRFDEALARAGAALRGNAGDARAWQYTGLALAGLGRDVEAREAIARSAQLDPAKAAEGYNRLGVMQFRGGRLGPAAETLRQAQRLRPNDPEIRGNLDAVLRALKPGTQPATVGTTRPAE